MSHSILLTGATGYIGGRLLTRLAEAGHHVRCLARRPEYLRERTVPSVELVQGNVLDPASLARAMEGIDTAYYLVQSTGSSTDPEELDFQAALNFGSTAKGCGVRRIIYLGGLGDASADGLSRGGRLVGQLLSSSGMPVLEFRASVIIGSGSLSFELIRALVERMPVMMTPKWMNVETQPIAVEDVLDYLCQALEVEFHGHQVFEIGGSDRTTYAEILREYAKQRRIHRFIVTVPVLLPRLSSLWLGLVTPLYARIGRKLIDSVSSPFIVREQNAVHVFRIRPKGVADAIAEALRNEDSEFAETHWWQSLSASGSVTHWGGSRFGNRLVYQRHVAVDASPSEAFAVIQKVGGNNGWYYGDWLWEVRGFIDLLAGGVGLRRGRRHPVDIRVGDVIDWWRVDQFKPGELLSLHAEMKLPGRAWLEFAVENHTARTEINQRAIFDPVGLMGLAYWYGIYPLHALVFRGMLRNMSRAAEASHSNGNASTTAERGSEISTVPSRKVPTPDV